MNKNHAYVVIFALLSMVVMSQLVYIAPIVWKVSGGSFVSTDENRIEIIYEGKLLANYPDSCMVSFTDKLKEIEVTCDKNTDVFINGVRQERKEGMQ